MHPEVTRRRTKGSANRQFAPPQRHNQGHQSRQADGCQNGGQHAECREHAHGKAPGSGLPRHRHPPERRPRPSPLPDQVRARSAARPAQPSSGGPAVRTRTCWTRIVDCAAGIYTSSRGSVIPRYRTSSTTPTTVCHRGVSRPSRLALRRHQHQFTDRIPVRPEARGRGSPDHHHVGRCRRVFCPVKSRPASRRAPMVWKYPGVTVCRFARGFCRQGASGPRPSWPSSTGMVSLPIGPLSGRRAMAPTPLDRGKTCHRV